MVHSGEMSALIDVIFSYNLAGGDGPAVLSLGAIVEMANCTFIGNSFFCEPGTYLEVLRYSTCIRYISRIYYTISPRKCLRSGLPFFATPFAGWQGGLPTQCHLFQLLHRVHGVGCDGRKRATCAFMHGGPRAHNNARAWGDCGVACTGKGILQGFVGEPLNPRVLQ